MTNRRKFAIIPNPFYKLRIFTNVKTFAPLHQMKYPIKRSHFIFYQMIKKAHLQFSKKFPDKNIFPNLSLTNITRHIIGDPKYIRVFLKLCIISTIISASVYFISTYKDNINNLLDKSVKSIVINKVCRNPFIVEMISYEILNLVKQERIKKLMRGLITNEVLPNKGLKDELYRIVKREILAYIRSEHCRNELKILLISEVMRNEGLRNDLYSLIKQFITLKEINFLEDELEKILVDVLNIEAIHNHVARKIEVEARNALKDENLIRMTVNLLSERFK